MRPNGKSSDAFSSNDQPIMKQQKQIKHIPHPAWRGYLLGGMLLSALAVPLVFAAQAQTPASSKNAPATGSKAPAPPTTSSSPSAEQVEFFEKKVRPLLVENCFGCHGPNNSPPQGNFRIDSRAALLKGGDRGTALNSAKPLESSVLAAVSYTDPHFQMPPKGRLTEEQIGTLTEWYKMGAPFPAKPATRGTGKSTVAASTGRPAFDIKARMKHWAWQPIQNPAVPAVKQKAWCRTPIDAFVLAKLEAKGLKPAPAADRRTLIRRVTYDLIGLPPTPAEVSDFLNDKSPNAYEKVVDRLLASPHYGERWGRHWLDLVRYAETDGHEFDMEKLGAWQYRDYVIRAMNADLPFNQFVMEHLAGDLLPQPRLNPTDHFNESMLGTAFFWLGSGKHSPVDLRDDECERVDNQIDVLGKAFLGVGIGCARCHDHKFDAISSKDYYALYGFLKSSRQQVVSIAPPLSDKLRRDLTDANTELQRALLNAAGTALTQSTDLKATTWTTALTEAKQRPAHPLHAWAVLNTPDATRSADTFRSARENLRKQLHEIAERTQKEQADITWMLGPDAEPAMRTWYSSDEAFTGFTQNATQLTLRSDPAKKDHLLAAFPCTVDSGRVSERFHGALRSQTFTITKKNLIYRVMGRDTRIRVIIAGFQRIQDPLYGRLQFDVNSPDRPEWRVQDLAPWVGQRAYIEISDNGGGYISVARIGASNGGAPTEPPNPLVLRLLEDPNLTSLDALAHGYEALFHSTAAWLQSEHPEHPVNSAKHQDTTDASYCALLPDLLPALTLPAPSVAPLTALRERRAQLDGQIPGIQLALCTADGTGENERVHLRGNYRTLGTEAPRRFLEACGGSQLPTPEEGSGRLRLAQRIASASNPLTARVIVNRLWGHHFGEGIVRTPDDFGVMGQPPTHPELLDWLATVFMQPQSISNQRPNASFGCGWSLKRLHRMMLLSSVYRMDSRMEEKAELVDPQNKLLHRMPVRRLEAEAIRDAVLAVSGRLDTHLYGAPVMPNLNAFTPGRGAPSSGPVDGAGRRSIYLSMRRNFPVTMLAAFDYPVPTSTIGRRTVSSVPAQALTMLNDPFVVEQASVWAKRILSEPGDPAQKIDTLYETAFSRPPTESERTAALAFVTQQGQPGKTDDPRAWADLCHVLYNVKEFMFVK